MAGPALNEITIILQLEERGNHHLIPGLFFCFPFKHLQWNSAVSIEPLSKVTKSSKEVSIDNGKNFPVSSTPPPHPLGHSDQCPPCLLCPPHPPCLPCLILLVLFVLLFLLVLSPPCPSCPPCLPVTWLLLRRCWGSRAAVPAGGAQCEGIITN